MRSEKSCGAIVFRKNPLKYLILYRAPGEHFKSSWDFPRGNVEEGEKNEKQVAIREVEEETGIKDLTFYKFREEIRFFFRFQGETIRKTVIFRLAETKTDEIKLSEEHDEFKWATYEEALETLTQKSSKEILKKAHEFLKEEFKQKTLF
ncbi:MAG: NUDIX domain-containing protein [archaeon]|nr:MAG: NUDIX domain-containing protein [archaeon]